MKNGIPILTEHKQFMSHVQIDLLIKKHEELYAKFFHAGNLDLAKAELLIKRNSKENLIRNTGFVLPLWRGLGIDGVDTVGYCGRCVHQRRRQLDRSAVQTSDMSNARAIDLWRQNEFPVYRGMAFIVLWIWCWALSLHVWTEGRVNYLYMLELDPRDAPEATSVFESAARHTIVIFAVFLLHFKIMSNSLGLDQTTNTAGDTFLQPGYVTLFLISYGAWHVLRTCCKPTKIIWRVFYHTVTPCFRPVSFIMNYTGDVLCSLSNHW